MIYSPESAAARLRAMSLQPCAQTLKKSTVQLACNLAGATKRMLVLS